MSDRGHALYAELFGDPDVSIHLSSTAIVKAMLDVEVALARAGADAGVIPAGAVAAIVAGADAASVDLAALAHDAAAEGNLAIPLVRALRRRVAAHDAAAADWVHYGATSQDIIDTGMVLQLGAAVPPILASLAAADARARRLAAEHARTVMAGRTWLQQATPVTFGLTAAGWADAVGRVTRGLRVALEAVCVVQLGGATGTLAALGDRALDVRARFAQQLGLGIPELPWHTHRDRLTTLAAAMGVAVGTLGKIARDVSLLAQTEIGELRVATGGSSSAMPHKRNPVGCAVSLAAAARAPGLVATLLATMPQELERGLGGWQAEWEVIAELTHLTGGSARALRSTLDHVVVDAARMRTNLAATAGANMSEAIVLALARHVGRERAQTAVAAALRQAETEHRTLLDVMVATPEISRVMERETVARLLDPAAYIGVAEDLVARVLRTTRG
jgi:3-carboxy-cis,cis-muconate cycloisomerase